MLRFLDSDVELIINVHGKERQITTLQSTRDVNGYRIIKFQTPKFIQKDTIAQQKAVERGLIKTYQTVLIVLTTPM